VVHRDRAGATLAKRFQEEPLATTEVCDRIIRLDHAPHAIEIPTFGVVRDLCHQLRVEGFASRDEGLETFEATPNTPNQRATLAMLFGARSDCGAQFNGKVRAEALPDFVVSELKNQGRTRVAA
jgi:hypothetical protein